MGEERACVCGCGKSLDGRPKKTKWFSNTCAHRGLRDRRLGPIPQERFCKCGCGKSLDGNRRRGTKWFNDACKTRAELRQPEARSRFNEYQRMYRQRPEAKAKDVAHKKTAKSKMAAKKYDSTPERKTRRKATTRLWKRRPESIAKHTIYYRRYRSRKAYARLMIRLIATFAQIKKEVEKHEFANCRPAAT